MTDSGNTLLIRPVTADPAAATAIDAWLWTQQPARNGCEHGANPPDSDHAILLLPVSWMHIRRLQLPVMSASKLAQALPYALEDYVAGDVEQLHVVSGRQQADGSVLAAVIDAELLQSVLTQLQALSIMVVRAVPDALCLPQHADGHSIMALNDGWLLRASDDETLWLRTAELEWLDAAGDDTATWHFYAYADEPIPAAISGHVERHDSQHPLQTLATQIDACPVNLLRGRFAVVDHNSGKLWRMPALAAVVAIVLLSGYAISDQVMLQRELQRQQQQVQQQMRRAFPEITSIVNPRVQAERALAARSGTGGDQLLSLLQATAPVIAAQQQNRLQSMEYVDAQLRLQFVATSVTALDEMLSQLRQQGLQARLEGVTSDTDSVRAAVIVSAGIV